MVSGFNHTTAISRAAFPYTFKHKVPSITIAATALNASYKAGANSNSTGVAAEDIGLWSCRLSVTVTGTPLTAGEGSYIRVKGATDSILIDARH